MHFHSRENGASKLILTSANNVSAKCQNSMQACKGEGQADAFICLVDITPV